MVGQGCNSQQSVPVRDFCIQTVLITMLSSLNMMFFLDVLVFLHSVPSPVHTKDYLLCTITNALITNYNFGISPVCAILHSVGL